MVRVGLSVACGVSYGCLVFILILNFLLWVWSVGYGVVACFTMYVCSLVDKWYFVLWFLAVVPMKFLTVDLNL